MFRAALLAGIVVGGLAGAARATPQLSTFAGRDYKLSWPGGGPPKGALVFLHGLSKHPFAEESEGIDAIARIANAHGFVAIFPRARTICGSGTVRCWSTSEASAELVFVDQLVDEVERTAGVSFKERQIVGYSNGGFLLGVAIQRGLVDDYTRIGVLSGGGGAKPVAGALDRAPPIFLEAGSEDPQLEDTRDLFYGLRTRAHELRFREVGGGHEITAMRCEAFLEWFWRSRLTSHAPPRESTCGEGYGSANGAAEGVSPSCGTALHAPPSSVPEQTAR